VQFFFVSRGDVRVFRPANDIDPTTASRCAARAGVEVVARRTLVRARSLEPGDTPEIEL